MSELNTTVTLSDGQSFAAYLATPASGSGPGIVLLQEIFGVNAAMRAAADDLAAAGFVVLVPDMFWRLQPEIELGYSDEDRQQAFGYWQQFDNEAGASDAAASLEYLKSLPACTGTAGYVGFCLGGKLAVMAAAKGGAAAAVSFYGVKLQENHAELSALECPLQIHVGDNDAHVPLDVIADIEALTKDKGSVDTFIYEGAGHGFFNKVRKDVFDKAAWTRATQRAEAFLSEHLG